MSRLADALLRRPEVSFAYLFGSHARGRAARDSDLDVAVWIGQGGLDLAREKLDLLDHLGSELRLDRIDVAILNAAPATLRYMVQKEGRLLFERDPAARISFECRARKEYWDLEPLLRVYGADMVRRLREGTYGS